MRLLLLLALLPLCAAAKPKFIIIFTDEAIEFVTANKDRPFFLYLPHSMPHIPLFVPEDAYDPDLQNAYKCVIEHISTVLTGAGASPRDEFLYYSSRGLLTGIRTGPWKLLILPEGGKSYFDKTVGTFLFKLDEDLGEQDNLAERLPDKVAELTALMKKRDADLTAASRPAWTTKAPHAWPDTLPD